MPYDVFICHASEDKDEFVRPLAEALVARGLDVWFDEFSLDMGDRLRQAIDKGLSESRFGVVVLSPHFFAKRWPQDELDGLFQREVGGEEKVVLPVWHDVDRETVLAASPLLAGRLAARTDQGIEAVADSIVRVVDAGPIEGFPEGGYREVVRGRRLDVIDLPRNPEGIVHRRRYVDCHLRGPAVFFLQGPIVAIGTDFSVAQFWPLLVDKPYVGAVGLSECRFERCTMQDVGFAASVPALHDLLRAGGASEDIIRAVLGPFMPPRASD